MERKTPPQGYICHRCKVPGECLLIHSFTLVVEFLTISHMLIDFGNLCIFQVISFNTAQQMVTLILTLGK